MTTEQRQQRKWTLFQSILQHESKRGELKTKAIEHLRYNEWDKALVMLMAIIANEKLLADLRLEHRGLLEDVEREALEVIL